VDAGMRRHDEAGWLHVVGAACWFRDFAGRFVDVAAPRPAGNKSFLLLFLQKKKFLLSLSFSRSINPADTSALA
jgi:hypothetical protein